jgi:tRNA threonylcarbamoyladenosine biosynthesis protein TsaB
MKILALDTATQLCSAALWIEGSIIACEEPRAAQHGERILPMIEELLSQSQLRLQQLDAIAFGRGPGAFTGVRLALSVAQGLALAAELPVMPISDLRAVALQALQRPNAPEQVLVCQDARMGEVYWGCFRGSALAAAAVGVESVAAPQTVRLPLDWNAQDTCGAGSGFAAYGPSLHHITAVLMQVFDTLQPRAREIAQLAATDGLQYAMAPEQAQPVYLRDNVARVPDTIVTTKL